MVKLELFSVLILLLLSIGCSFTGVMSSDAPTSIGNYEPNDAYIPSNFTIPSGNVYKFKLYSGGYVWYRCNSTSGKWGIDQFRTVYFNNKEDSLLYPSSAVAVLDFRGGKVIIRSAIPKHDTSTMTVTVIGTAPSANPKKDYSYELISVAVNTGKGAFADVTYLILSEVEGGAAPPDKECGTTYPDGYIYSTDITATILYFHPDTK
ncbi:putative exported protein [Gigaspora margarita]|uniref:Putative exported protein n=1 Tax=Gigaspora margarita TaxID=4874 RepID=A0A8H3X024_GIGMA|nr:putative exported protein [Gigaspora margarita]